MHEQCLNSLGSFSPEQMNRREEQPGDVKQAAQGSGQSPKLLVSEEHLDSGLRSMVWFLDGLVWSQELDLNISKVERIKLESCINIFSKQREPSLSSHFWFFCQ